MRTSIIAVTFTAALASSAFAQQAAPPLNTFMSNKDIMALVDKAKADRKGDAPLVAEPVCCWRPVRPAQAIPAPRRRPFHEDAELMVVLDGTGNIVTDEASWSMRKRINANNLSGPHRLPARRHYAVVKGDMIIIPALSPVRVSPTGGAPIVIMALHVPYPSAGWPAGQLGPRALPATAPSPAHAPATAAHQTKDEQEHDCADERVHHERKNTRAQMNAAELRRPTASRR